MRVFGRSALIAAMLLSLAGMAGAAEIRVLGVDTLQKAVATLAGEYQKETGDRVKLSIAPAAAVMQKIKGGETFDVVIVAEAAMDALDADGRVNPESRLVLAGAGLGIAVRAGAAPALDLASPDAFKQALSAARAIACDDASAPYQSGAKVERLLRNAGLLETLQPKLRPLAGTAAGLAMIAKGEADMGLYDASEIAEGNGIAFAGQVPAPLQVTTSYEGALLSDGAEPEASRAFIQFLATSQARPQWLAARLEPLGDR
jgi:molybdate transport system substrate-binding protein